MAQRQWRSDDTSKWAARFGTGSDGAYSPSTGTDSVIDSACSGTSGATSLTATNAGFAAGQLILIHQTQGTGAGNWELNAIANYSAGTITTSYPLMNTYGTGAQVLVMPQYSSGNIAGGVTITGKAWNGTVGGIYAKFCNGTFTIAGSIVGSGVGYRGGAGSTGSPAQTYQGEGTTGVGGQSSAANGNGGGGAAWVGANSAGGGGGGNGAAGSNGGGGSGETPGTGGNAVGNAALTSMLFGGGGGGAADSVGRTGQIGGGICLIIVKTITISGSITTNGITLSGAASGAGGSILLKGQTLTLGSTLCQAAGGSNGRIHADYSATLTGTTSPTIDSTLDKSFANVLGGGFLNKFLN